jgi:hypothetical protein
VRAHRLRITDVLTAQAQICFAWGLILRFRSIPTPQSAIRSVGHDSPGQSKNCIQHQRAKAGSCGNARSILTLYRARPTRMISFTDIDAADMATRFYKYRPPP